VTRRLIWLILGGLLLASAINVIRHDGWSILALLTFIAAGGALSPLLTWFTAARLLRKEYDR
jgi:hypothetical protein